MGLGHVLIAEADQKKREWLRQAASAAGRIVEVTDTWASALTLMASHDYDLIIGTSEIPTPLITDVAGPAGMRRVNVVRLSLPEARSAPLWLPAVFATSPLAAATAMASFAAGAAVIPAEYGLPSSSAKTT